MNERINESLSALIDGETDELEVRRVLKETEGQDELLDTWGTYHLIGALMRDEPAFDLDLAKGVRQALDGKPMDEIQLITIESDDAPITNSRPSHWRKFGMAGGVAASVMVAVLVTAQWQRQSMDSSIEVAAIEQSAQDTQVNSAAQSSHIIAIADNRLNEQEQQQLKEAQQKLQQYVLKHSEDTNTGALPLVSPYSRTVNFQVGEERRQ